MSHYNKSKKVVIRRVVSPDGKIVSEVKNVVTTSDEGEETVDQTVSVEVNSNSSSSSSSTYSYSSTSVSSSTSISW